MGVYRRLGYGDFVRRTTNVTLNGEKIIHRSYWKIVLTCVDLRRLMSPPVRACRHPLGPAEPNPTVIARSVLPCVFSSSHLCAFASLRLCVKFLRLCVKILSLCASSDCSVPFLTIPKAERQWFGFPLNGSEPQRLVSARLLSESAVGL